jgi:hypothetical protein
MPKTMPSYNPKFLKFTADGPNTDITDVIAF